MSLEHTRAAFSVLMVQFWVSTNKISVVQLLTADVMDSTAKERKKKDEIS